MSRHLPLAAVAALLASCFHSASGPDPADDVEVTVLLAYSGADTGRFPDYPARIRSAFAETREVFARSGTGVRLEIAGIRAVPFVPEERLLDLQRLVRKRDGFLDEVHRMRDDLAADIVVFVSALPNATVNASLLATDSTAFAVVAWEHFEAPVYGLAHELGHLFGAMHEGTTGPVAEQFPQGFPFADDSVRTVIAGGSQRQLPYFSNPDLMHEGTALGVAGQSDIASVIRATAPYVAGFRGEAPTTDFVPAGTVPTLDYSE